MGYFASLVRDDNARDTAVAGERLGPIAIAALALAAPLMLPMLLAPFGGYAFNLGWEAALIIARRVISDRLMTAAIKGEEARWVREEGVTTYTRQNTKLSLALLDRITDRATPAARGAAAARRPCRPRPPSSRSLSCTSCSLPVICWACCSIFMKSVIASRGRSVSP